jgi:hypothetical protein
MTQTLTEKNSYIGKTSRSIKRFGISDEFFLSPDFKTFRDNFDKIYFLILFYYFELTSKINVAYYTWMKSALTRDC